MIYIDSVPKSWQVYPSLELNSNEWILDFKCRIKHLMTISEDKDFGKNGLWLGGLIFPEAYLTATRQSVAQLLNVSLDELMLSVEIVKKVGIVHKNEFVLKGLCMEGAEWDFEENKLVMSDDLYKLLPPIILKWEVKTEKREKNIFPIPVYINNMRKNLLFSVYITNDSELAASDWYQRGISLISWNKTYDYINDS